jgi:glycerol-3-phosphate dehydrogenase
LPADLAPREAQETAPVDLGSVAHPYDLLVVGGGINGCGIARDAAGRGLSVKLLEMEDLGAATSSASTKLIHGGLRYLEHFKFRLVREALQERDVLLKAMPHIAWPMRFVLPIGPGQRRAGWLLRLGLFVYDRLGGRGSLPGTETLMLAADPSGAALKPEFVKAYEYSDGWVDDARLVILNARDAAANGADVAPRTRLERATRVDGLWRAETSGEQIIFARGLVNAAGPWVADVLNARLGANSAASVRLVRGSHIVVRQVFAHEKSYFLQQPDGRIIFAIPYEGAFTLIGTTDSDHEGPNGAVICTPAERDYLLDAANRYFATAITAEDIVWTYSGVRPLYDDGASSASSATRDYVLEVSDAGGAAPLLSVFGGKITTYRRLAEAALVKLGPFFEDMGPPWTAGTPLPGGNFAACNLSKLIEDLRAAHPFLDTAWAGRLIRAYGLDAFDMLHGATGIEDMGQAFGATLTAREVDWLCRNEWARTAEDICWRRSKLGLRMSAAEIEDLQTYFLRQPG